MEKKLGEEEEEEEEKKEEEKEEKVKRWGTMAMHIWVIKKA